MKRHGSASTAESSQRRAGGLVGFVRGALATRASSRRANGSGAPTDAATPASARSRRAALIALASTLAFLALASVVPAAGATQFQRPFIEDFGSVEQPTFGSIRAGAVDQATGDVLVGEDHGFQLGGSIRQYHSDGTPAPFTALGGNVIDGEAGPGGKPCGEEPASCDETPQGELELANANRAEIAIDNSGGPTDGDIYVTGYESRLVNIFAPDGSYLGQLTAANFDSFGLTCGVTVDPTGAVYVAEGNAIAKFVPSGNPVQNFDNTARVAINGFEAVCSMAIGSGPTANSIFLANQGGNFGRHIIKVNKETLEYKNFVTGYSDLVTVDPSSGNVLAYNPEARQAGLEQFVEFNGTGELAGNPLSVLNLEEVPGLAGIRQIAADASGKLYVGYSLLGGEPASLRLYGLPAVVPTVTIDAPSNVSGTSATLTGSVNPSGLEVTGCRFEWALANGSSDWGENSVPCEGSLPTDSNEHAVHADLSGLTPNGAEYEVRLAATNENGTEHSAPKRLVTAHTIATEAATEISLTSVTLNGTVLPEGNEFSKCLFEYGLAASASFESTASCSPPAAAIEADFSPHAVKAAIGGLQAGTRYRFRLVGVNSNGTHIGEELTFTTLGVPQFTEIRARDADEHSVTLEGKINPSGFATSYHFEWGPTSAYGHSVPAEFEPFVGAGTEPILVTAKLTGLSAAATYHYRLVATNRVGTVKSPDQAAETLNSCGLPEHRCFELVSPRDAGPVAVPGEHQAGAEMLYQAAPSGPGALAYIVESGFPESTTGAEVLYLARRDTGSWSSAPAQISPPITGLNERGEGSGSGETNVLNGEMTCGVVESFMPLTHDPGMKENLEAGGSNLFRRNADGSYTPITALPPQNPPALSYHVAGMSEDCGTVLFSTQAAYPGISGVGSSRLYEWHQGSLRNVGVVPGPSGETAVEAAAGDGRQNFVNALSEDGSRAFFTAERQTSPNPEEIGATGVFVREEGTRTRDVSLSEGPEPDRGATYQYASNNGSRVFFTANTGLTTEGSSEGTDLYEYDLESESLTDLSVSHDEGGAEVLGFVGGSADGSHVYFVAQGQLVPGRGKTLAQNRKAHTVSLYGEVDGVVSFVATVFEDELSTSGGSTTFDRGAALNLSRVSPDGRYLAFETAANVTGYESGGAFEAYLYDAEADSEETVCVSCRQDAQPSVASNPTPAAVFHPLSSLAHNEFHQLATLVEHQGQARVFFTSLDGLAPGAPDTGEGGSIYEWTHGQVFRIDSDRAGLNNPGFFAVQFDGANATGSDLYISSKNKLTWEDADARGSVYDARIGGGFPEPAASPSPCNPVGEGSCQGPPSAGPSVVAAGSSTLVGPGNVQAKPSKKPHKKPKKHKKRHHGHKNGHAKRHGNSNRRAGK